MKRNRIIELLRNVLEFEFEELSPYEHTPKQWAMEKFDISEEEYNEIFKPKKNFCYMVEETGRNRHEFEPFTTSFGLYETLEDALERYKKEREDVLNGDYFYMREEILNGDYVESETISSNGVKLPLFSIESDEENYELYICEVEMN